MDQVIQAVFELGQVLLKVAGKPYMFTFFSDAGAVVKAIEAAGQRP